MDVRNRVYRPGLKPITVILSRDCVKYWILRVEMRSLHAAGSSDILRSGPSQHWYWLHVEGEGEGGGEGEGEEVSRSPRLR